MVGVIFIHFFVIPAGDLAPVLNSSVSIAAGCTQGDSLLYNQHFL